MSSSHQDIERIRSFSEESTNDATDNKVYLSGSPVLSLNSEGQIVVVVNNKANDTHSQSTTKPKRKRKNPLEKKMKSEQQQQQQQQEQQSFAPTSERHLSDDIAEYLPEVEQEQRETRETRETTQLQLQISEEMAQYLTTEDGIIKYIDNLWYPIIFLGTINPKKISYRQAYYKARMTEKEKVLFDWANKFLQTRECIDCVDHRSPETLRAYSYHISRYISFMALERNSTPEDFVVDGFLMTQYLEKRNEEVIQQSGNRTTNGIGLGDESFRNFKYAMGLFNRLLTLHRLRDINNASERFRRVDEESKIPNIHLIDVFLQKALRNRHKEAHENYHNKHRTDLIQEKYDIQNLEQMMVNMYNTTGVFREEDANSTSVKSQIADGINAVLECLLGHYLLFRGDNKRNVELSDAIISDEETNRGRIPVLGFKVTKSKTLKGHQAPRAVGCCRNVNPAICLYSAVALSLWFRFDYPNGPLYGKNFPDFTKKSDWYDIKVLYSIYSRSRKPISYNYERDLAMKCMDSIGFIGTKRTHIGRRNQCQMADANQISEAQIRRAGHWQMDVLEKSYLHSYPYDFIMFSGGFSASENYYLPREQVIPSEDLQKQIFPWLEDQRAIVQEVDQSGLKPLERDDAIFLFFQTLERFRVVILQDLAILTDKIPNSIFARHPITKSAEFLEFKQRVLRADSSKTLFDSWNDKQDVINGLVPSIVEKFDHTKNALNALAHSSNNSINELAYQVNKLVDQVNNMANNMENRLKSIERASDFIPNIASRTIRIANMSSDLKTMLTLGQTLNMAPSSLSQAVVPTLNMAPSSLSQVVPAESTSDESIDPELNDKSNAETEPSKKWKKKTERKSKKNMHRFTPLYDIPMNRSTLSVPQLVREWYDDSYSSLPDPLGLSVNTKNQRFGSSWRKQTNNSMFYWRRNAVIRIVNSIADVYKDIPKTSIASAVDAIRVSKDMSLDKFCKLCQGKSNRQAVCDEVKQLLSKD